MNKSALLAALIMALLGGFLLFGYLRRFEDEASGGAPVKLLVARKQIEPGTVVTEEMLAVRVVPAAYVETRAVREAEKSRVVGLRMGTPVQANQTLLWTDLAITADDKRDLSSLVQPGMRAVGVRAANDDRSFALIRPGDRVDVIATLPVEGTSARQSLVLLQNVLVLAVGIETSNDSNKSGAPAQQDLILNLSLTIPEAQLVALAQEKGRLSVALRNPDDLKTTDGVADLNSNLLTDTKIRKLVQDFRKQPTGPIKLPSAAGAAP
ncbi:MAG: Flp pilus assembly protein CpaB [Myxococcales bacterium]|nr:Flp pilus assembly protein CpaB [Myxococcales bacterium]